MIFTYRDLGTPESPSHVLTVYFTDDHMLVPEKCPMLQWQVRTDYVGIVILPEVGKREFYWHMDPEKDKCYRGVYTVTQDDLTKFSAHGKFDIDVFNVAHAAVRMAQEMASCPLPDEQGKRIAEQMAEFTTDDVKFPKLPMVMRGAAMKAAEGVPEPA